MTKLILTFDEAELLRSQHEAAQRGDRYGARDGPRCMNGTPNEVFWARTEPAWTRVGARASAVG
jgi:hypothetical protein